MDCMVDAEHCHAVFIIFFIIIYLNQASYAELIKFLHSYIFYMTKFCQKSCRILFFTCITMLCLINRQMYLFQNRLLARVSNIIMTSTEERVIYVLL